MKGCQDLHPDDISTFFNHKDASFLGLVGKYRPNLEHINLDNSLASDEDLVELLNKCRHLRPEHIRGGSRGDVYCKAVASQFPDLKEIDLNNATEKGLVELIKGCSDLHPDKITGCSQKGDAFLRAVVKFRADIEEITLEACDVLTDRGLATLVSDVPM